MIEWCRIKDHFGSQAAIAIVEAAESQLGLEALRSWLPDLSEDPVELRSALVDALCTGQLRLIQHARAHEPLRAPEVHALVDLIEAADHEELKRPWLEVSCLGPKGESYAFNKCRVRLPDGTTRYATLDHRSSLRLDDVPEDGTCQFELSQDARPDGGRLSPPAKAVVYELGTAAAVATSAVHVLTISTSNTWVELEVQDSRGRPVRHLCGTLRTSNGPEQIELDPAGVFRQAPLPDAAPVSVELRAEPVS
ncbi:MAG: hypothetical protein ACE37F_12600 [Nannocystaceae bacterium]|nr:hypothetical protein [bacterium]